MEIHAMLLPRLLLGGWLSAGAMAQEAERPGFEPKFFAFENGLGFGTAEEEATFLKELGFDGVSQIHTGGEALAARIAVCEAKGLEVLSIYLDAGDEPVDAEVVRPFAGRDALIELTINERTDSTVDSVRKTCGMAGKLGLKVALYPHHGSAVATMGQAIKLSEEVDHPNLGVMFNLCHFLRNENVDTLEKVLADAGQRLFGVSVSGADVGGKEWDALIQTLDQGAFPQERLLRVLRDSGYQGPVTLQCYGIPGDKRENLRKSMAAWKKALGELDE